MRIFKNVFTALTISMIGFGIFTGVMFPYFILWMGVSKEIALSKLFFVLCILAGIIVSAVNIALARIIVKKRLLRLSNSMIKAGEILTEVEEIDFDKMCGGDSCIITVDSDDVFGKCAHAFNQLLKAFQQSLHTQNAIRKYNRLLTSELQLDMLAYKALADILSYTHSGAGAIFVVKSGTLELAACDGLKDASKMIDNERLLKVLKTKKMIATDLPIDVKIDGLIDDLIPRKVIIEPIIYKGTSLGAIVLASLGVPTHKSYQHIDMFSNNLALALNNSFKHSQLKTLVAIDPLTSLYNRRFGYMRLSEEYSAAIRCNTPLGLLMLDIDHFKTVNDTYGHIAGDKVLINIAQMAKAVFRKHDILIRFGGEEFIGALPGASTHDTIVMADRLRALVEKSTISYGDHHIHVTISIGVVSFPETDITKFEDLIKYADEAMYEAKIDGRNKVCIYKLNKTQVS